MHPLDVMTSDDYGVPITGVMPMGGLLNVDCTGDKHGVARLVAVGDAFCHTDPAFAYGVSFALAHAEALDAPPETLAMAMNSWSGTAPR